MIRHGKYLYSTSRRYNSTVKYTSPPTGSCHVSLRRGDSDQPTFRSI